jgi:Flp pilus assembly pilin Flp
MQRFLREEDGAITVDWVLLTAAMVSFGIFAAGLIGDTTWGVTEDISTAVSESDDRVYE